MTDIESGAEMVCQGTEGIGRIVIGVSCKTVVLFCSWLGIVDFFWRERGQNYRRIAMDSNEHVGGRGQWLHTWHWQHAVDTRASHLLTKVWTWQTPSVRWTEKH